MMTRLEKKCFVGSAAFHGALLLFFLFGSAFVSSKPQQSVKIITIAAIPTDKLVSTGGSRTGNPQPPPPAPQPEVKPPEPQPPTPKQPEVKPPEPKLEPIPEPVKPEPKKEVAKPKDPPKVKEVPTKEKTVVAKKPERQISTNITVRPVDTAAIKAQKQREIRAAKAAEQRRLEKIYNQQLEAYNRQRAAIQSAIGGVVNGVGASLGNKTVVEPLGDGDPVAFAHYGSLIGEIYKRAVYATRPQSDQDAIAVIRIVVQRNGMVKDADWVRRTGDSALDKAVDRAMKSVRTVPPFPEGATDAERTFRLNIGFEAKRGIG